MNLEIYKKGQGVWARGTAYLMTGLLLLFGSFRLHAFLNRPGENVFVENVPVIGDITLYKIIALAAFLIGMLLLHLVLNRQNLVDIMIDTENEMKKVSWPSWREVKSATIVVTIVTLILAVSLYGFDKALQAIFRLIYLRGS